MPYVDCNGQLRFLPLFSPGPYMVAKTQTLGGNISYPHKAIWMVNGVLAADYSNQLGYVNRKWRYRAWNTQANWKALLESQGYLNTLGYTDSSDHYYPMHGASLVRYVKVNNAREHWTFEPCPASSQALGYPMLIGDRDVGSQLSEAKYKALAKARDMKVNLAVAFGEGRKTVQMIYGLAQTLGKAYGHFRRGRFGKAARVLGIKRPPKAVAQNWLAYIYGWSPLVSDIIGAAETLAREMEVPRSVRFTVRSKVERHFPFDGTKDGPVTGSLVRVKGRDIVTTRAGLLLQVNSLGDQFAASIGFGGVSDLALVAWELIPFSFVFDWIVNIGQYIESISALSGVTVLAGWQISEVQRKAVVLPANSATWRTESFFEWNLTQRRFSRSTWSGDSPTWPVFRALRAIDATKITTVGALYQQLFRNDPPIGRFRPPWLYGRPRR